jgi:hypothetical protein
MQVSHAYEIFSKERRNKKNVYTHYLQQTARTKNKDMAPSTWFVGLLIDLKSQRFNRHYFVNLDSKDHGTSMWPN